MARAKPSKKLWDCCHEFGLYDCHSAILRCCCDAEKKSYTKLSDDRNCGNVEWNNFQQCQLLCVGTILKRCLLSLCEVVKDCKLGGVDRTSNGDLGIGQVGYGVIKAVWLVDIWADNVGVASTEYINSKWENGPTRCAAFWLENMCGNAWKLSPLWVREGRQCVPSPLLYDVRVPWYDMTT
jgi:hypothetical protein